jgi:hypothetical protein
MEKVHKFSFHRHHSKNYYETGTVSEATFFHQAKYMKEMERE